MAKSALLPHQWRVARCASFKFGAAELAASFNSGQKSCGDFLTKFFNMTASASVLSLSAFLDPAMMADPI